MARRSDALKNNTVYSQRLIPLESKSSIHTENGEFAIAALSSDTGKQNDYLWAKSCVPAGDPSRVRYSTNRCTAEQGQRPVEGPNERCRGIIADFCVAL